MSILRRIRWLAVIRTISVTDTLKIQDGKIENPCNKETTAQSFRQLCHCISSPDVGRQLCSLECNVSGGWLFSWRRASVCDAAAAAAGANVC